MNRPQLGETPVTSTLVPDGYPETSYPTYKKTLTANQNVQNESIVLDNDADFMWLALAGSSTGSYELTLTTPNNRLLNKVPILSTLLIGTGNFPVPLPKPLLCSAGSTIRIPNLNDLSGAGNAITIVLVGYKIFPLR